MVAMRQALFKEARTVATLTLGMLVVLLALSIAQHPISPDAYFADQLLKMMGYP